jgi:UDP-glucose 4-epimerase
VNGHEAHDYLYVRDCAVAICTLHLAQNPKHTIYNVGFGKLVTFDDSARILEKMLPGSVLQLGTGEFGSSTDTRPKTVLDIEACLDISRIKEEFGFSPQYDLEKGLSALVAWVRDGVYQ